MRPDVRAGDIWAGRLSGGKKVIYRVRGIAGEQAICLAGRKRSQMPIVLVPLHQFKSLELVRRDAG